METNNDQIMSTVCHFPERFLRSKNMQANYYFSICCYLFSEEAKTKMRLPINHSDLEDSDIDRTILFQSI